MPIEYIRTQDVQAMVFNRIGEIPPREAVWEWCWKYGLGRKENGRWVIYRSLVEQFLEDRYPLGLFKEEPFKVIGLKTRLQDLQETDDPEAAHFEADHLISGLLRDLGYGKIADEWEKVGKWYA